MSLATRAPCSVSRGAAIALDAAGPIAIGGILAARVHDPRPMVAAPAIVFGVVAATAPALYIATAAAGHAPPLAAMTRAFGVALGAFGVALAGLILPAAFAALSSVSSGTAIAASTAAIAAAGLLGLRRLASELAAGLARVEDDRGIELPVDLAALAAGCAARPWPAPVEVAAAAPAVVPGHHAQLSAALDNLVANAAQFAEAGTAVRIALEPRGAGVRVTVANRGPALSAAARAQVWDRFYSTRAAWGGSGLGLAIVRSVALGHGGAVGVDCVDGVTAFWLELPARRPR